MKKRGFTIIEVVLVLAITGLILAGVFLGLPALQRAQRNTQRRADAQRVFAAIHQYLLDNDELPFTQMTECVTYSGSSCTEWGYIESDKKFKQGSDYTYFDMSFVPHYIDDKCEPNGFSQYRTKNGKPHVYVSDYKYKNCGDQFTAPDGVNYKIALMPGNRTSTGGTYWDENDYHRIYVQKSAKCHTEENRTVKTDKPNDFLVAVKLEGAAVYCVDAQ